jgi:uncharacterized protein YndB with AHSA1/START domain
MATESGQERSTCVSRVIKAPRRTIYEAFLDPEALVSWLPPEGMKGHVSVFDAREGGAYRMSLTYVGSDHSPRGKTSEHTDVVRGRFLDPVRADRAVDRIRVERP